MTSLGGEQTVGDAAHAAVAVILGHRRERPLGPVHPEHAPGRDPPPATVLGRRGHGRVEAVDTQRRARRESDSHRSRRQMEHLDEPVGEFGPVLGHQPNLSDLSTARTGPSIPVLRHKRLLALPVLTESDGPITKIDGIGQPRKPSFAPALAEAETAAM